MQKENEVVSVEKKVISVESLLKMVGNVIGDVLMCMVKIEKTFSFFSRESSEKWEAQRALFLEEQKWSMERRNSMDPVATALIAAVVAGATGGLNEVSKTAIGEAYGALKEKLQQRFGPHHALIQAVEGMEKKPTSEGRQSIVVEEVQEAGADQDEELRGLAEHILTVVKPQQAGMGKYTIQNTGTVQGQTIGEHNTITQHFGQAPKQEK